MTTVICLNFERLSEVNYDKTQATRKFMRLNIFCGLIALTAANSVFSAGLIDERSTSVKNIVAGQAAPINQTTSAMSLPFAAPVGVLTGNFSLAEWSQISPPSGDGVALSLALVRLTPSNLPAIEIEAPANIVDFPVKWTTGATRKQALEEISRKYFLNIAYEGRSVTARRVVFTPPTVPTGVPGPTGSPGVDSPVDLRSYEIKLSDIKISTSMNRWAAENNVRIRWDADKHVLVGAPMVFRSANILDAISQALSTPGIKNSDYPLEVCEYPNNPPLLRITRQGEQTKDCPISVSLSK